MEGAQQGRAGYVAVGYAEETKGGHGGTKHAPTFCLLDRKDPVGEVEEERDVQQGPDPNVDV